MPSSLSKGSEGVVYGGRGEVRNPGATDFGSMGLSCGCRKTKLSIKFSKAKKCLPTSISPQVYMHLSLYMDAYM
jgi:hypothetical protein